MEFGSLPVEPLEPELVIVAHERWRIVNNQLNKTYKFRRIEDREKFVNGLFAYERQVQHNACIIINSDEVSIVVNTKTIDQVTEPDKKYASLCDVLYRDIVYNISHEKNRP